MKVIANIMAEREYWSIDQVDALISIWEDEKIKKELASRTVGQSSAALFQKIRDKLESNYGINKTRKQVNTKINNILQKWKQVNDHNGQSGVDPMTMPFLDRLDGILKGRPISKADFSMDSSLLDY